MPAGVTVEIGERMLPPIGANSSSGPPLAPATSKQKESTTSEQPAPAAPSAPSAPRATKPPQPSPRAAAAASTAAAAPPAAPTPSGPPPNPPPARPSVPTVEIIKVDVPPSSPVTIKLPAFLSPREDISPSPRPDAVLTAAQKLREREERLAYRAAIRNALDTARVPTPATGRRAAAKNKALKLALPALSPRARVTSGEFAAVAPQPPPHVPSSHSYREGMRLTGVGMDLEAGRSFLEGLKASPHSTQLRSAFDSSLYRARCTCRNTWAQPCPSPSKWKDAEGKDERIRGVTWSVCPHCGALWPDNPKQMLRLRRRKGAEGEEQEEEVAVRERAPKRIKEVGGPMRSLHALTPAA